MECQTTRILPNNLKQLATTCWSFILACHFEKTYILTCPTLLKKNQTKHFNDRPFDVGGPIRPHSFRASDVGQNLHWIHTTLLGGWLLKHLHFGLPTLEHLHCLGGITIPSDGKIKKVKHQPGFFLAMKQTCDCKKHLGTSFKRRPYKGHNMHLRGGAIHSLVRTTSWSKSATGNLVIRFWPVRSFCQCKFALVCNILPLTSWSSHSPPVRKTSMPHVC